MSNLDFILLASIILVFFHSSRMILGEESVTHGKHHLLIPGKCRGVWRTDKIAPLPGKCFGLNPHIEFPELKDILITNFKDCRSLCCNLMDKCTTWQYHNSTGRCMIHPKGVRRGPEGADTPMYCDPFPPARWNGMRLKERKEGKCEWGEEIPSQCFAFGMEKLNSTGGSLNTQQCAEGCCNDPNCDSWQEMPGRGCYWGVSDCKYSEVEGAYDGGRKCIPGFCNGMEHIVLKHIQHS